MSTRLSAGQPFHLRVSILTFSNPFILQASGQGRESDAKLEMSLKDPAFLEGCRLLTLPRESLACEFRRVPEEFMLKKPTGLAAISAVAPLA